MCQENVTGNQNIWNIGQNSYISEQNNLKECPGCFQFVSLVASHENASHVSPSQRGSKRTSSLPVRSSQRPQQRNRRITLERKEIASPSASFRPMWIKNDQNLSRLGKHLNLLGTTRLFCVCFNVHECSNPFRFVPISLKVLPLCVSFGPQPPAEFPKFTESCVVQNNLTAIQSITPHGTRQC
jgi:hypothetical protein